MDIEAIGQCRYIINIPLQPMTYDQILSWQYANGIDDDWFVAVGGNPSPYTKKLLEIKAIKDNAPQLQVHVIHSISRDDDAGEWILFESQEEIVSQLIPLKPLFNCQYNMGSS